MIRKVYLDFMRDKVSKGEFSWLYSRGRQYLLTHLSYLLERPLCGPILGTVVTNYNCNYRCSMCDLGKRDEELRAKGLKELDTAGMKGILRTFALLGTSGIGFTGGEPLMREDIFDLLAFAKHLGMISHLNTNGSLLDDKAARRIISARVDSLNISLDGARAETHDKIRGVPGAFDRAVDAVGRVRYARKREGTDLRIKTVAVLQEANIGEVGEMLRLAEALGVDCIEFIPCQSFKLSEECGAGYSREFLDEVDKAQENVLGPGRGAVRVENSRTHLKLFRRSFSGQESPLRCYAGYNSCAVDCYGEVYPCVPWYNWRRSVGNIQGKDLSAFWRSEEYNLIRREIRRCRKCYLNCQTELNIMFNFGRSQNRSTS